MKKPPLLRQVLAGFTLLELLVTVTIMGILAAILMPMAGKMIGRAQDAKCLGNLRQIATGIRLYAADNNNAVPMTAADKKWHRYIQDYMASNFGSSTNVSKVFICPADPTTKTNSTYDLTYDMNSNLAGKTFGNIRGTVLMVTESPNVYTISGLAAEVTSLFFNHVNNTSVNVLYVDGSAEPRTKTSIKSSTQDPTLWKP